jgi:DNA-binding YbaB/EbfC family protein
MAKGGFPGGMGGFGGGGGMGGLMKQAQKMQKDMEKAQEELENLSVEASSGGGAVTVVITGKKVLKQILIKPEVVDPDDVEMLQDLILVAVNEGVRMAEEISEQKLGKISGGLSGLI